MRLLRCAGGCGKNRFLQPPVISRRSQNSEARSESSGSAVWPCCVELTIASLSRQNGNHVAPKASARDRVAHPPEGAVKSAEVELGAFLNSGRVASLARTFLKRP